MTGRESVTDVACTVCGCVCDDLTVTVDDGRIVALSPGCSLADPWLLRQTASDVPPARIEGRPAPLEQAAEHAAAILCDSASPLIYGLSRSSTPGQRAAVELADCLHAYVDTTASTCHAPSIMALQVVGESTATLGEIRNRADLVIYWGSNPLESHPRHVERFVEAAGMFVPEGRGGRHLVVVDVQRTATANIADSFLQVEPGRDFELIWALRAMLQGLPIEEPAIAGVPRDDLMHLAAKLRTCRYGAVFFGLGLTKGNAGHAHVEALLRLVTELNAQTRFVARRMRVPGDVTGADTVLAWQTGFPFSVSLSRGYPRYNPGEYTANVLLERREVDAVLFVGSEGVEKLSPAARQHLERTRNIVLDYPVLDDRMPDRPSVQCPVPAVVQFTTAVYGIHRPGTAYRMDEVPIPLRKVLDSPLPADHEVLAQITDFVKHRRRST